MMNSFQRYLRISNGSIGIKLFLCTFISLFILAPSGAVDAASRIKDIATFEGVRDNILVGYGLVVGLNGTGDTLSSSPFTEQSLVAMLERLGVNTRDAASMKTDNVAAVVVTASLPPFARQGTGIDVVISSMGDADSLLGGTLLVTPLMAADGEVYAVAQGSVIVGGFSVGGEAATVVKGVPTSGRISNGGIVERELGFDMTSLQSLRISLRNPDLTTSRRMADAINKHIGHEAARSTDPSTVVLNLPGNAKKEWSIC